jgi:hypothetical protein
MNKHTAITANGEIITRNSKTKNYKHCVVVWSAWQNKWVAIGWASRLDLAQNVLNKWVGIFNSGMSSKHNDVKDYFVTNYGDKLQIQILNSIVA